MSVWEGDDTTGVCDDADSPWLTLMGLVVGCFINVFSSKRHRRVSTSFCHSERCMWNDSTFSSRCLMVTATGTELVVGRGSSWGVSGAEGPSEGGGTLAASAVLTKRGAVVVEDERGAGGTGRPAGEVS